MPQQKPTNSEQLPTDKNSGANKRAGGETHQQVSKDGAIPTTNQGVALSDNQNSLKAGDRGPTLLEDFILREKITHFDHERIPERIVHARGSAAHGYFQPYKSMKHVTSAAFLSGPKVRTPVFVRFSTVAGGAGSVDLPRDVRGFAVKFYTQEGNFDLVGNNIPVFFIQDAIKFPDLIHAVKMEADRGYPQAASAHDTFWDFISLMPESLHMIMWAMSDRAIPRSFRMMEGFGVNTFRLVTSSGKTNFVKFHWRPMLGTAAVLWDEAVKISGADPDFIAEISLRQFKLAISRSLNLGSRSLTRRQPTSFRSIFSMPRNSFPRRRFRLRWSARWCWIGTRTISSLKPSKLPFVQATLYLGSTSAKIRFCKHGCFRI
jgi:catalase